VSRTFRSQQARKRATTILYIGIAIIIVGLIIAAIPLTWTNMLAIADDWEGSFDQGYYRSYDEGSTAVVSGRVTGEYPITLQDDPDFYAMGYRYCYELDNVWEECPLSKKDYAEYDDQVDLTLKLEVLNVGGDEYWVWTVTGRADRTPFYTAGVIIMIIGFIVTGIGAARRTSAQARVKIPSTTYGAAPTWTLSSPGSQPTSVLEGKKYCTHCGAEMPVIEIKCPECGKSKFDA
jgi:uncharacterized membrane protein